jgi:hypothetical protein
MVETAAPSILFDGVAQLGFLAPLTHDGFRLPPLESIAPERADAEFAFGASDIEPDERN